MSETVLNALVKLFAIIADIHDETIISARGKDVVRLFLARNLNNKMTVRYMAKFEEYLSLYSSEDLTRGSKKERKRVSLNAMRILAICEKINEELQQKQKVYVLVQLLDFISLDEEVTENELDFLQTVSDAFNVPAEEYRNIKSFIMNHAYDVSEKDRVLVIDNKKEQESPELKHIYEENLRGKVLFLHIPGINTFIMRYEGADDLYLNGQNVLPGQTYVFDHGSTVRGAGIRTIYYSEVNSHISGSSFKHKVSLIASDVTFKFRNSENGIQNLNFQGGAGELIGIMGGSGAGKSTTFSILNGMLMPDTGRIIINGYDLYDEKEKKELRGVIGFVPQDDLLIEDLTVFQNIYYNARMCLDNLSDTDIIEVVNKILADFDLDEVKDLKVGNPLRKVISGGQRKRVNIALEMLREPTILFVDEPTSGLSSVDSETVMNLLKEQTYKGKLVIINIHQPASAIYKMFDKIMIIDKGGYQVWFGNPTEAVVYFKTVSKHVNPDEDQCDKCGNIDTDQMLRIIEAKVIDEQGKATRIRKISPEEWAEKFSSENVFQKNRIAGKESLPENNFSIPGLMRQSWIFFIRDLLAKLSDRQYIIITLLGAPLLAFLLAYFLRYIKGSAYHFSENENIPAYLFMCVITSLFFGLMASSEEIVKDRKILKRESFLNLSWLSYLYSKIFTMFLLSAIQSILFILIGNMILGIRGMTFSYWLVLFTTSCFANILGLNISSAFDSVITIYILIPFIIIPQLLFSGVLVKFDRLHISSISSKEYVPLIGDLMTARWSFEALAVKQFRDNEFEKHFFKYKMEESQNNWYGSFLTDRLTYNLMVADKYYKDPDYKLIVDESFNKLNHYIDKLSALVNISPGEWKYSLNAEYFSPETGKEAGLFIDSLKKIFLTLRNEAALRRDLKAESLVELTGKEGYADLQTDYVNEKLRFMVLDEDNPEKSFETRGKIIQKYEPGYMEATSRFGRAHFYAPYKRIGNTKTDTFTFNLVVIWIVSFALFLALYHNLFRKLITYFENLRIPKSDR